MSSVVPDDQTLIRRFAESRETGAFECLVNRYSGLVYNTAMRKGAAHALAQEITQDVFVTFARKAPSLTGHENIAGWIYGTAIFTANNALRKERRHREKMESLQSQGTAAESGANQVLPILDGALASLRSVDREVILEHYFVGQTPREIASASGRTEAAVRKRLSRSLKKLESILKRRGVAVSVAALSTSLSTELARAIPEGVAATVSQNALELGAFPVATTTASTTGVLSLLNAFAVSRYAGIVMVIFGASIPVGVSQLMRPPTPETPTVPKRLPAQEPGQAALPDRDESQPDSVLGLDQLIAEIRAIAQDAATADPIALRSRAIALQLNILDLPLDEIAQVASEIPDLGNASPLYPIVVSTFERWAKLDPAAALSYALTREERFYSAAALESVFSGWARHDPEASLKALVKYPDLIDTDKEHQVLAPTLLAIAERDPTVALDLLRSVEQETNHAEAVSIGRLAVLSSWANRSPDEALAWIESKPQSPEREGLKVGFIEFFGRTFPEKAVSLATKIERHQTREDGIRDVLQQWGSTAPAAAATAYLDLPDSVRTQNLTMNVVQLIGSDPDIALDIAEKLPAGYHQDAFVTQAVNGKARSSPSEAAKLAERLPDGWGRRNAAESVARAWIEQDRAAALQWVETTGFLTEKAHQRLLQDNPEP